MEKLDSGCIILKNKEYEELLAKANANKPDEIKIAWDFLISYGRNYAYKSEHVSGNFKLSDNLLRQIREICLLIDQKHLKLMEDLKIQLITEIKEVEKLKFSKLSWWNRLFFKT